MARCDEGYPCRVCGEAVTAITESGLYLRYVLGEFPLETLHRFPEHHVRCAPEVAQFIAHPSFEPIECHTAFAKSAMRPEDAAAETVRVTTGWRRLRAIPTLGLALPEYPLAVTPFSEAETPA